MKPKKLSNDEQLALRKCAKAELLRLEQVFNDQDTTELLNKFKNRFNICESVYKVVLAEHQKQKNKNTSHLQVNMSQAPHALCFAGYSFKKDDLNELFGHSSKKGKTVKKLRDAVTHGIDPKAVNEIILRKEELFGYMDSFLSTIRNFDNAA